MPPIAGSSTLNVQPRQRRSVYEALAKVPEGRSVKELLGDVEMSEPNLRESPRKLDAAGLATRAGGLWTAVRIDGDDAPSNGLEPA